MKAVILLFGVMFAVPAMADDYSDHYDSSGPFVDPNMFIDPAYDTTNPFDHYDGSGGTEPPSGAVDVGSPADSLRGTALGATGQMVLGSEEGLSARGTGPLQSGAAMTTIGETWSCPEDNVTYSDRPDCDSACGVPCVPYTFSTQISCQKSEEIIKVEPVNPLSPATPFKMTYKGKTYTTNPVTAMCVNGYLSGADIYEWYIGKTEIGVVKVKDKRGVGECRDVSGKAFFSYYSDYYDFLIRALPYHASKLGYVASAAINPDLTMSVSAIVAGSCDGGTLVTSLPNAGLINQMAETGKPDAAAMQTVTKDDKLYNMVVSSSDPYTATSCEIRNNVSLSSESKEAVSIDVFTGTFPNVTVPHGNFTRAFNWGTAIGITQNAGGGTWTKDYLGELSGAYVSSILTLENGAAATNGNIISLGAYITEDIDYTLEVTVLKTVIEDKFEVVPYDGCSSVDKKKCSLIKETVCSMTGDCVVTFENGSNTGHRLSDSCGEISTSVDKYLVCSDGKTITAAGSKNSFSASGGYPLIKREYSCKADIDSGYDYSSFLEQNQRITDTAKVEGDKYSFEGIDFGGGTQGFVTDIKLDDTKCVPSCKVKINADKDNANIVLKDGSTAAKAPGLMTAYYKQCVFKDDDWKCQLGDNETAVLDGGCTCPDDFVDTIVSLKFVDEVARNKKCSSK